MEILEFLKDQPIWLIVFGLFIYAAVKLAPTFFPQYFDKKNCEEKCKDLQIEVEQLKQELKEQRERTAQIIIDNQERNDNYNTLKGAVTVIKKTLEENGFAAIQDLIKDNNNG